ncbi:hypothetical protein D9758_012661 [Tetrapyrgos nigripes]|uniref:HTH CENPB-type domain-containing protein n=1 Tax=Tetrapyrgos nigripes TaxID=182062 RepID=A0A8H5GDP8_9AGAR|nr:hypothetical protein D9758_012661 [Tetrapyrgos nigripes]
MYFELQLSRRPLRPLLLAPQCPKNRRNAFPVPVLIPLSTKIDILVLDYIDKHRGARQDAVSLYFANRTQDEGGALILSQSTVSRIRKNRNELRARAATNPTALSAKKERAVQRPDVERCLYLWVRHIEDEKCETVSGPMLQEKRAEFEEGLGVPQEERLSGQGWIGSFCKAYNIRQIRRHVAEAEQARCSAMNEDYPPEHHFNGDKSSFFWTAPPDRGLATREMHGKKKDKKRITLLFACNETASYDDGKESMGVCDCRYSEKLLEEVRDHSGSGGRGQTTIEANENATLATCNKELQAWGIMRAFLLTSMTHPDAEKQLLDVFKDTYDETRWLPTLNEITETEPDSDLTPLLEKIETHLKNHSTVRHTAPASSTAPVSSDLTATEKELLEHVQELRARNCIHGRMLTMEEMLNPVEENEIGESEYRFGEKAVEKIIEKVTYEEKVKRGEIIEVDDDDEDEETLPDVSLKDLISGLQMLELQCKTGHIDDPQVAEEAMELERALLRFRGSVTKLRRSKTQQTSILHYVQK